MGRSTVHYADNKTNNALKKLHNKLRPAGTPVQRVEYIIELLLLRIFETKIKQDEEFKPLRELFTADYKWKNPKTGQEESNENRLFSYLQTVSNDQILSELNDNFFPFYSTILQSARNVFAGNLPQKVQDQLVLIEEVFSNSNFTNNVNSGNLGEVIDIVTNDIEEARLLNTDLLGDAIESALSETGGTKDIGLFRTPDHIRQFMTALIEPTFDDVIFDPACGTGGFLFDAFEFVMRRVDSSRAWPGDKAHSELKEWFDDYFEKNPIEFPSIEQTTKFYRGGVAGIEYLGMIRKMAAINFYIRGLNPANIEQGDSLAKYTPVTDAESKSVILANPPFGAERDQEAYPDVWGEYSKESETTILFVKLMFELLKPGGQCVVIVSEGFHNWDQFSAKALRKMLLDEAQLKAVISLPQGIFVSKSGVGPKTSILIFEKGGQTDWTWFYKVTNDGYTMGTNRKEQKGNQLIECLELYHQYIKKGKQPPESKNQFCIPSDWIKTLDPRIKEKIRIETRADMEVKGAKDREKKEKDLSKKVKAKKLTEHEKQGELNLFDQMLENKIKNEIAKRIDKAHLYSLNLGNYKSNLGESQITDWKKALNKIEPNGASTLDEKYKKLYSADAKKATTYLASLNPSNALEADIAREYLNNTPNDKKDEISLSLAEILSSQHAYPREKLGKMMSLKREVVKLEDFNPDFRIVEKIRFKDGKMILREESETAINLQIASKGDLLISKINFHQGATALNNHGKVLLSLDYLVYDIDTSIALPEFIQLMVRDTSFLEYVAANKPGGIKGRSKPEYIEYLEIPLPDIDEQKAIVQKIEKQKAIIESAELILKNWEIDFQSFLENHSYQRKSIDDLIINSLYGTSKKAEYQNDGYNVLRIGNIGFCGFDLDDIKKCNLTSKEFEKYKLEKGDFLIVRSNGNPNLVGKCAVWNYDVDFVYASYLIRFKFDTTQVLPGFVMYYLMSPEGRAALNPQAGGGTYNISATEFKKVMIPLPKKDIQLAIVEQLDKNLKTLKSLDKMRSSSEESTISIISGIW